MAVVVVASNGRLFESAVHPLDLTVGPWVIWLREPMLNIVRPAEQIEHVVRHRRGARANSGFAQNSVLMWGLGTAVVIGPLNGGMEHPEAFRRERTFISTLALALGRSFANLVNALIPGKRRADIVLVANRRIQEALPTGITGRVVELVEWRGFLNLETTIYPDNE